MVIINGKSVITAEEARLAEDKNRTKYWKKWGPFLSERQWATVREDYSNDGDAWSDFPHDHARSRAYRWGEDGIAGVSDSHQYLCVSFAFWNEKDPILKERMFGLTGHQGNHGEDVKEYYYYLDNLPSHAYMKYNYKYPQSEFPYKELVEVNSKRSKTEPEFELVDTGIFKDNKYFDCFIETAKTDDNPEELYFKVSCTNRSSEAAPLHVLSQVWFRNTWSWGYEPSSRRPTINHVDDHNIKLSHYYLGDRYFSVLDSSSGKEKVNSQLLYTNNTTNFNKLYGSENKDKYCKDAFHEYIINKNEDAVDPDKKGTKACAWFSFSGEKNIGPGETVVIKCRLTNKADQPPIEEDQFEKLFEKRLEEADDFYLKLHPHSIPEDQTNIHRQAYAGLLWSKQYYRFIYKRWLEGDPLMPKPPATRKSIRNMRWKHIWMEDILSMPDKWEYPFFAAWDLAFHCVPIAKIDPECAKRQLIMLTREWYMHPNGQIPAYEWNFSDVNPPVHAWSCWHIYKTEEKMYGVKDTLFLERMFQKLLMNFTWWINQKDYDGNFLYEGGFLGLDNIGLFNRSEALPTGGVLEQADATSWMAFYSLGMLQIAVELSKTREAYADISSKFFEHFLYISDAMAYRPDPNDKPLWDDKDGFYYDSITWGENSNRMILPCRSLVGLIPLYAVGILEPEDMKNNKDFQRRMDWFSENKPEFVSRNVTFQENSKGEKRILLSLVNKDRLKSILEKLLDENEFLSEYGIRSLSKYHEMNPYTMVVKNQTYTLDYVPGDSNSGLFGGNSNWRGPIWMPTTFLLIESIKKFYTFYGSSLTAEFPTRSGNNVDLGIVAHKLNERLIHIFTKDKNGNRAYNNNIELFNKDPAWNNKINFYEYFHADNGHGLGASHQTGWTALIATIIEHISEVNAQSNQA